MKIELKNIKHSEELSDDSNAFSANLYVNGKFIATCTDNGNGGEINIKANKGCEAILREAKDFAKTLPKNEEYDLEMDMELVIGGLVEDDLFKKEVKKVVRKEEKLNIVCGNSKSELKLIFYENLSKKKIPIQTLLSIPSEKIKLQKRITSLIADGYTIYNKNIPREMIDGDIPEQ
ncbi:hypothetical protein [Dysgonomonas sp. ZJ709]|uniref:hypothetical protein n=1 Tax=Dysgonomonas sp. ZJ709 TaxID=2709797 RepID=UPI0013EA0432|nr:hypothetical protein [Dysgonomonas sp. ZJ709]